MRELVLLPLRLAVGWGLSPRLLGLVGITMLVLLRLSVGWHFYTEGVDKVSSGKWSAAPFFANAKGPFAEHYRGLVWDHDGKIRLDRQRIDSEWKLVWAKISDHYKFDKKQNRQAQEVYKNALVQYDHVIDEYANDLEEYELGKSRVADLAVDPVRDGVSSLGGQRETIRKEWVSKGAGAMNDIEKIWENLTSSLIAIATPEQIQSHRAFAPSVPRSARIDTSVIDSIVPYFDIAVGLCILFGLFTPVAALAAAGFLISVFLSQYPPTSGPGSTYYQLIEGMACLVLAGTGAGRFAGLDYFLHLIVRKMAGGVPSDEA
ncbi:DoxX [Novipirellula galeiformis]|uniref:DoxX n=1 Tax=Novipirellula galeiformis TaxID=2528004 RepID=A0A5C6CUI2_9BACT|nr:DoxX family protein [Novipirellula galeiformis]TWU26706.1 DoxX [Novipirellula galeiformis]